jgi:hypothetical protein
MAVAAIASAALVGFGAAAPAAQAAGTSADSVRVSGPDGGAQFAVDGVRIRACASLGCTVLGLGYRNHVVGWYCQEDQNGFVHIHDWTTGVDGWASNQLMYYYCD